MNQEKRDELKLNLANIVEMADQIKTVAEYLGEQVQNEDVTAKAQEP